MKRINDYIRDYPIAAQTIVWVTVFFIACCMLALSIAVAMRFYNAI